MVIAFALTVSSRIARAHYLNTEPCLVQCDRKCQCDREGAQKSAFNLAVTKRPNLTTLEIQETQEGGVSLNESVRQRDMSLIVTVAAQGRLLRWSCCRFGAKHLLEAGHQRLAADA